MKCLLLLSLLFGALPGGDWEEGVARHFAPGQESYQPCSPLQQRQLAWQAGWMARAEASPPELEWTRVESSSDGVWTISPRDSQWGWGMLACRPAGSDWVLQIPHPLADRNTSTIGLQLFRQWPFQALVLGGCHRRNRADGTSDLAHTPVSAFMAWHQGLTAPGGARVVLQIHGFEVQRSRRNLPMPPDLGFIVADGSGQAPEGGPAWQLYHNLGRTRYARGVLAGPTQPWMLATTNAQKHDLRTRPQVEFVHLELDSKLRRPQQLAETVAWILQALPPGRPEEVRRE